MRGQSRHTIPQYKATAIHVCQAPGDCEALDKRIREQDRPKEKDQPSEKEVSLMMPPDLHEQLEAADKAMREGMKEILLGGLPPEEEEKRLSTLCLAYGAKVRGIVLTALLVSFDHRGDPPYRHAS